MLSKTDEDDKKTRKTGTFAAWQGMGHTRIRVHYEDRIVCGQFLNVGTTVHEVVNVDLWEERESDQGSSTGR